MTFNGFSPATGEFLWGLSFNNERPWFEAHREDYTRHLLEPFRALAWDTDDAFRRAFPGMSTQLHIARIYRDARRLHGHGPYKDHLWFSIKGWDGLLNGPMFWFEIGAADYRYGMGFYSASPLQMEAFRKAAQANPAKLRALAERLEAQDQFVLTGECYKRPKCTVDPLLDHWLNRKRLGLECSRDHDERLYSPALVEELVEGFRFLMPYYEYLMDVIPYEARKD